MSEVDQYLEARDAFGAADQDVRTLASELLRFAKALADDPETAVFQNCVEPPSGNMLGGYDPLFDAKDWPSAEEIQKLNVKRSDAFRRMQEAFGRIPAEFRSGVAPPHGRK